MKIKDILKGNNINEKKLAIGQVLNLSIPEILINKERTLSKEEIKLYKKFEKQINKGLPIQYILKKAYFYGEEFYINKNVLIPRPETEYLIENVLEIIKKQPKRKKLTILDIGTGSGVIAITLSKQLPNANIVATDISRKALKVAKHNQQLHHTNVKFVKTNLYKNIKQKFDIVISNPPYIEKNSQTIERKVKRYEPKKALYGGEDGLKYFRKIIKDLKTIIKKEHIIAFEIGEKQGLPLKKIMRESFPKDTISIKSDYNNYDRFLFASSKNIDN